MNVSYSKIQVYETCPRKYKHQYLDKLYVDETHTPLLFGAAIDQSLNYVLLRKKHNKLVNIVTAKALFDKYMNQWHGQNKLNYFKNEIPSGVDGFDYLEDEEKERIVFNHLKNVGHLMLETYVNDILPTFKTILSVQTRRDIQNEAGDTLVLITDFRARLEDGREVTFDNKTSSDINKYYGPNSVVESKQLATYVEFEDTKLAGYVAMQKKLVRGKIKWKIVIDEIPESKSAETFENIDVAMADIKAEKFEMNTNNCQQFGRSCQYFQLCHFNDDSGLLKKK